MPKQQGYAAPEELLAASSDVSLSKGAPVLSTNMKAQKKWYEHFTLQNLPTPPSAAEQRDWVSSSDFKKQQKQKDLSIQPVTIDSLRRIGLTTLNTLSTKESAHKSNQMTTAWVQKMLNNGTILDKVSALSLQIKYQQLTTGQYIESLLALCQRRGNKETNLALETLRDLFLIDLLPKGRKLRFFHQQPWVISYNNYTDNPTQCPIPPLHQYRQCPKDDVLALFILEDILKKSYIKFIEILEEQTQSANYEHIKRHRVQVIYDLLLKSSEQENLLLTILVNKFGDKDRTIASKVQLLLTELINKCPGMKLSIVKEIEQRVIFKPYVKQRTQYYGILFLTNLTIIQTEQPLAQYLLSLYLTIFQVVIANTIPMINEKKLATQAFFDKYGSVVNANKRQGHKDGKSKIALKKKAKKLLKHQDDGIAMKTLGVILIGVSRCIPYALQATQHNQKSAEQIQVEKVLLSHLDQLFHIASTTAQINGNVCVQSLALLSQVLSLTSIGDDTSNSSEDETFSMTKYKDLFYRCLYSVILFPLPFTCSRVKVFLNVLFRNMKNDPNPSRLLAFVKRLLQTTMTVTTVTSSASTAISASILYMISQLAMTHPVIKKAFSTSEKPLPVIKQDIMSKQQYDLYQLEQQKQIESGEEINSTKKYSIISSEPVELDGVEYYKVTKQRLQTYDPFEGDPLFTHSTTVGLYELLLAFSHFHPTLSLWAKQLILSEDLDDGEPIIQYGGDPIKDFTALSFLDNWVKKQPKKNDQPASRSTHSPARLILDPELKDYLQGPNNQFIRQFQPLYTQTHPQAENVKRHRHESEEDFVDRIFEEELLKATTDGSKKEKKSALEMRKQMLEAQGLSPDYEIPASDDEAFNDFGDDDEDDEDGEEEGESIPWDEVDFNQDLDEVIEDEDEDGVEFDDDIEFDDEDDFDEESESNGKTLYTAKGVFDDSDSEEDIKLAKKGPGKKTVVVPVPTKKATPVTAKRVTAVQKKKIDLFADIDVNDLDDNDDPNDEGSDGSDDGEEDLREILDHDETIAELLEESHNKTHKHDAHIENLLATGHTKVNPKKDKFEKVGKKAGDKKLSAANGPVKRKQPFAEFNTQKKSNKKAKR